MVRLRSLYTEPYNQLTTPMNETRLARKFIFQTGPGKHPRSLNSITDNSRRTSERLNQFQSQLRVFKINIRFPPLHFTNLLASLTIINPINTKRPFQQTPHEQMEMRKQLALVQT